MKAKLQQVMLCLAFAIPFGGIGAGAWYVIGKSIYDGHRAQEWVRVKANLQSFGDGNISYSYTIGGKNYHGDRLGTNPIGGTDNTDDWHDRVNDHLATAQSEGKPITVWVNPDNPSESMFDRSIRWSLLLFASVFAFAFGGVGLGALIAAGLVFVPKSTQKRLSSAQGTGVGVIWVFAFFWNVISIPVTAMALPQMWAEENWLGLLILLFPLIGVFLLWAAFKATWDYFRRGRAKVVFAKDDLVIGEPVQGYFEFGRKVKVGENFRVRLEAMTNPGLANERTLWSKEVAARVTDAGGGPRLSFRIDTPEKVRSQTGDDISWRLDAIANNRAADVHYKFPVMIEEGEMQ